MIHSGEKVLDPQYRELTVFDDSLASRKHVPSTGRPLLIRVPSKIPIVSVSG